jgi:hypothetical protein
MFKTTSTEQDILLHLFQKQQLDDESIYNNTPSSLLGNDGSTIRVFIYQVSAQLTACLERLLPRSSSHLFLNGCISAHQ